MSITVVNSGGANISSVLHALHRLGAEPRFTADPELISRADRVILPGSEPQAEQWMFFGRMV